jgi:hypothetical protein
MVGFPYDDLNAWRGPYPAEVFASQFEKVASGWQKGITELRSVTGSAGIEDQRLALAAGLHFESVANQARFIPPLIGQTGGMRRQGRLGGSSPGHATAIGAEDSHWQGYLLSPDSSLSSGEGA